MNQRKIIDGASFIPTITRATVPAASNDTSAEEIVFDKAERAEKLENEKFKLNKEISSLENVIKKTSSEENKKSNWSLLKRNGWTLELLEKSSSNFYVNCAGMDSTLAALHLHQWDDH